MTSESDILQLPVEPYQIGGYRFGQRIRRHIILWATHLGDDVAAAPGMAVKTIGGGEVVWAEMRLGSLEKRSWGGIVVVAHGRNLETSFCSVYGHMNNLRVKVGDKVETGQVIGEVAAGSTPENGWWTTSHLHFAVYTGPWRNEILPGYKRPEEWGRTKKEWWHDPRLFIETLNRQRVANET